MSIITGTGDDGRSALFGGLRVPKSHPRLEAYGAVDEAQCAIGVIRAAGNLPPEIDELLLRMQKELFTVGSDLASPNPEAMVPRVTSAMVQSIELECRKLEGELREVKSFMVPGGTPAAAMSFWARTVVRRAERRVAVLLEDGQRVATVLVYLNRMGDLLYLVARTLNKAAGMQEETWSWR